MNNATGITTDRKHKICAEYMTNRIWHFLLYYYDRKELRNKLMLNIYGEAMEFTPDFIGALRLHIFLDELVTTIIPLIRRRINFQEDEVRISVTEGMLRGRISWPETLSKWSKIPREISCIEPMKVFTIPENVLTTLTILEVKQNCYELKKLLNVALTAQNYFMQDIFEQLLKEAHQAIRQLDSILLTPQLRAAINDARKYQGRDILIKLLEDNVERNVYLRTKTSLGYIMLLKWRRKFKQQISFLEKNLPNYAILRIPVPKLYEIYGLLEIVHAICRHLRPYEIQFDTNQATIGVKSVRNAKSVKIYYNKALRGLTSWVANAKGDGLINGPIETKFMKGIPDTILEVEYVSGAKQYVVADYKFSLAPSYITLSRYKILGYMNEFNVPIGMLMFRRPNTKDEKMLEELEEEEVKDTLVTISNMERKGGALLTAPDKKRKLVLVMLEPKREYEEKNEKVLERVIEEVLSIEPTGDYLVPVQV